MSKRTSASLVVIALAVIGLTGCGDGNDAEVKKTEECIAQLEASLKEAGSDRDLRADEKDACADPDRRDFIMGE